MRTTTRLALLALAPLALEAGSARAESPKDAPLVLAPGHGVAASDDADSVVRNPANLGFLPSYDLRYTARFCPNGSSATSCGHGFGLATPLFLGLATGLRFDYLSSGFGVPANYGGELGWLSWALAAAPTRTLALGVAARHAYAESPALDGRTGVGASLSWRPLPFAGFSVVGSDLNASGGSSASIPAWFERSVTFATALRPFGTNAIDLGIEAKRYGTTNGWFVRGTGSFAIPYVGRLRLEAEDRAGDLLEGRWALFAGLDVGLGPSAILGGVSTMPNDGDRFTTVVGASLSGVRDEGLPLPARAVRVRIDGTPSNRGHVALLRKLWRLSESDDVAAVALDLHAEPASTLAHAEELADAVRVLVARGKKVVCAIEDGGTRALHTCADASRITLMRAGSLRWSGFRAQYIYLAEALDKLGVHWEYERIGAHKTAPEQFGRTTGSPEAHADYEALLQGQEGAFVRAVSRGRKLTPAEVRALGASGPFTAEEAKRAKLVDALAYDDDLEHVVAEVLGRRVMLTKQESEPEAPRRFGATRRVAVLWIDGDILDGKSATVPVVGMRSAGSDTIAEAARALEEDASVGAVVVRIESPGGSTVASERMWHAIARLAKKKPVVASLGSMAASGGYYAAVACPTIVATPGTVTGSIGVYFGKPEVSALLTRLGIGVDTYRTTSRADAETLLRPFTGDERAVLRDKIAQTYDLFLDRVATGRKLEKTQVDAVAQGRVWTGQDAFDRKLVDHLGGFREAVDLAYQLGRVARSAPFVELPRAEGGLLEQVLGTLGQAPRSDAPYGVSIPLTDELRRVARAAAPLWLHDASRGLLRADLSDGEEGLVDFTDE
jgi:protease-4